MVSHDSILQHDLFEVKDIPKLSLEKKAYQEIRKQITQAVYLPGTLLSENELASQLNMSRTPIRAAISLLETEGFLESVRGRGVFVRHISFRAFVEMFEVLASMQLFILDLASKRGIAFDLPALRSHLDRQILATEDRDDSAYYECSLLFIETILLTIPNQNMLQILEQIKGKYMFKMVSFRKMNPQSTPKPSLALRINLRIYEALKQGNIEEAKKAIHEVNELVFEQLKEFDI